MFYLPSTRTLAHYDLIGGNESDGLRYNVLKSMQHILQDDQIVMVVNTLLVSDMAVVSPPSLFLGWLLHSGHTNTSQY